MTDGFEPTSLSASVMLAGVDGCRSGWVAVIQTPGEALPVARVFPRFDFLLDALAQTAIVAVDMPIGLPERIEGAGRAAEKATRPLLDARQSSVFSMPGRAAVEAGAGPFRSEVHRRDAYMRACDIAARLSHPPRRISRQGFGLFPKIIEIDRLMTGDPGLCERVVESHPELAFRALNAGRAMALPKTIKGAFHPAGLEERRRLLLERGLSRGFLYGATPAGAAQDDFLDACALLFVAARYARGEAVAHPSPPDRDGRGLPIAIWA